MTLIEIVASMLILAVAALAITSTISLVSSSQMRSAGGSSLDLQALSYARETLESLKNGVSTNATTNAELSDSSYTSPCSAAQFSPCGTGTVYNSGVLPLTGLPATSDLVTKGGPTYRKYKVWNISSGTNTAGTDVSYKKVTVCVAWAPDTCAW